MNKITYCYTNIEVPEDRYKSFAEQIDYSKLQKNVCYYDKNIDKFLDYNGEPFSVVGKRILPRTYIEDMDVTIEAIERNGGIPVNTQQECMRILNWQREIPTERFSLFLKGKDILDSEEIKRKIVSLSNNDEFFFKTVTKDFSGLISINELFDANQGFLSALELHRETEFIVSEKIDILTDSHGKLEYRCFVVDGKILNISRHLFCTYHIVAKEVLEHANYLLEKIKKINDFPTTFCMDIMVATHPSNPKICLYDIVELNPLEATGEYLYNTVFENSIVYDETKEELVTQKQALEQQMKDSVPIYKRQKILGFTSGFEPEVVMNQAYYKDEFSYHYECAKKFGNPLMGRFWVHNYYSSGYGEAIDIIDILNGNICLNKALPLLNKKILQDCGANIEYMEQRALLEDKQKQIEFKRQ